MQDHYKQQIKDIRCCLKWKRLKREKLEIRKSPAGGD